MVVLLSRNYLKVIGTWTRFRTGGYKQEAE